jgi:hypothetical protein
MDIPLDEVIYFDVITSNPTTGAVSDADSAPTFEVFEEATDTAIVSGTTTKRTSKTGDYRGTTTLSTANGYESGKWYSIIVSGTVSGVSAKVVAKTFRVIPDQSLGNAIVTYDVVAASATSQSMYFLVVDSNGKEKTGLTFSDFDAFYSPLRGTPAEITLVTLGGSPSASYTEGGLTEISSTQFPGYYRLDIPNAAWVQDPGDKAFISLVGPSGTRVSVKEVTILDKTGYELASSGLDSIDNTEPSGYPTGWRAKMMWLFMRFGNAGDLNSSTGAQKTYTAAGAVAGTQTVTEAGTTQSRTKVS